MRDLGVAIRDVGDVLIVGEDPERPVQNRVVYEVGHLVRPACLAGNHLKKGDSAFSVLVALGFGQSVGQIFGTISLGFEYAGSDEAGAQGGSPHL